MSNDFHAPTAEAFEPLLESEFIVHVDEQQRVAAKLTSVTRLPCGTEREDLGIRRDPFSLIFKTADDIQLNQRIYHLEHETHGTMEVFLVPIALGEYECIFS